MLAISIFSFSHNVFYPLQKCFEFLVTFILLSAHVFYLDQSKILLIASIFSFSNNVFYPLQKCFEFLVTFILLSAHVFYLDQSKILLFGKELTLSHMPWFLRVCSTSPLKTLCNKPFLLFPQCFLFE